jgi:Rps23 Pro-64 3,4-dihydroxylase Tpa1-like proline 4-hydroxylase
MNRTQIADLILKKLEQDVDEISKAYEYSRHKIGYFTVDKILPDDLAHEIYTCFPAASNMQLKKSLREYKYIAAQMDMYNPLLEEVIYAFQDARIVEWIANVCGIKSLYPDEHLYAGGISMMGYKHFLNPHLDNSHDKDREKWRVFNLLYYVTPDWLLDNGGNLELWPEGVSQPQITIGSLFNRLVVMATHEGSWHSVSPIVHEGLARCCVSNYYFSDHSLKENEAFHVTSFRGRPEQPFRDAVLQADLKIRMNLRKIFKKGVVENTHLYKKTNND